MTNSMNSGESPSPQSTTRPLRIAVPNKGSLSTSASELLREAGYRQRDDTKLLTLIDDENGVEFFYLRPRDIALYVGEGTLDIGITGRDLLLDSGAKADEVIGLGFGRSRFHFAGRAGAFTSIEELRGKRIATSYVGVVSDFLEREGIDAGVTRLDGAVETSIQLGVADAIADVVETGSTMRQAGLEIFGEPIMRSEAVVITRSGAQLPAEYETFKRRLDGVLIARSYVMMDYDIRAEFLAEASAMTPGLEGPTVSPLHREGWVAVRAMVPRAGSQKLMDDLYAVGARAILLTEINACRI
ncbi:ATP phosphoribosyltransferase [Nocardioides sp. NPDC006273]|uniref:ATP phosphoribosyltransferase n=1 Tax=Nocardioides sp. NPDC006273 TaxID=3155598 RepID=UPI0033B1186D